MLFHNETWGGEKVFQLMSKLAENIPANRNLLELLYVVLAFGFEGRYRVLNDGKAQLESVRVRLSQMLRQNKGATLREGLRMVWNLTRLAFGYRGLRKVWLAGFPYLTSAEFWQAQFNDPKG